MPSILSLMTTTMDDEQHNSLTASGLQIVQKTNPSGDTTLPDAEGVRTDDELYQAALSESVQKRLCASGVRGGNVRTWGVPQRTGGRCWSFCHRKKAANAEVTFAVLEGWRVTCHSKQNQISSSKFCLVFVHCIRQKCRRFNVAPSLAMRTSWLSRWCLRSRVRRFFQLNLDLYNSF